MITIKLMLDYDEGPIWPNQSNPLTFEKSTGVEIIDNDDIINEISTKMRDMYDDCYEFDSHDVACWFNKDKFIDEKNDMIKLLDQLISRLNKINDGSFIIEDRISEMYNL